MIASKRGCNFSPASLSVPCLRLPVSGASSNASDAEPHLRFYLYILLDTVFENLLGA